jgi:glycosyltransferase involved in cell wall biosynthesis
MFNTDFIIKNKITLIHSHGRGAGVYSRLAGFFTNTPIVHTYHGLYLEGKFKFHSKFLILFEIFLNILSSRLIYVSESESQYSKKMGVFCKNKSLIISNGVKLSELKYNKPFNRTKQLITVTRLESEKGNLILIDLIYELFKLNSSINVLVVGDGPERETIEIKVKKLGLESIIQFLGFRDDISNYLKCSDLFISCSHGEGLPIAILEAMVYSLPIFASRVRGHTDLIKDDVNGILFSLTNLKEAAIKLNLLINDDIKMKRLGENGRLIVIKNYSSKRICEMILNLYQEVILSK